MNYYAILVSKGFEKGTLARAVFSSSLPAGQRGHGTAMVEQILEAELIEHRAGLLKTLVAGTVAHALVIALDSAEASNPHADWADDLEAIITVAATHGSRRSARPGTFQLHANRFATAYLVPLQRLPKSISLFINSSNDDINDSMRGKVEQDLRQAIESDFSDVHRPSNELSDLSPSPASRFWAIIEEAESELDPIREKLRPRLEAMVSLMIEVSSHGSFADNYRAAEEINNLADFCKTVLTYTNREKGMVGLPVHLYCLDRGSHGAGVFRLKPRFEDEHRTIYERKEFPVIDLMRIDTPLPESSAKIPQS